MGICTTSEYDVEVEESLHVKAALHNTLPCQNPEEKRDGRLNPTEEAPNVANPEENKEAIDIINPDVSVSRAELQEGEYS